jgi:hypothetical protein
MFDPWHCRAGNAIDGAKLYRKNLHEVVKMKPAKSFLVYLSEGMLGKKCA